MALFIPTSKKRSEPCQTPRIWGRRMEDGEQEAKEELPTNPNDPNFELSGLFEAFES